MKTKKTITYLSGCKWCNAIGTIANNNPVQTTSFSLRVQCPVCKGEKTVLVTEVIETEGYDKDAVYGPPPQITTQGPTEDEKEAILKAFHEKFTPQDLLDDDN